MKMQREDHKMDKRSIFERGFAILLSVIFDGGLLSAVNLCGGHDSKTRIFRVQI